MGSLRLSDDTFSYVGIRGVGLNGSQPTLSPVALSPELTLCELFCIVRDNCVWYSNLLEQFIQSVVGILLGSHGSGKHKVEWSCVDLTVGVTPQGLAPCHHCGCVNITSKSLLFQCP